MGGKFRRTVIFNQSKGKITAHNKNSEKSLQKMKLSKNNYQKLNSNNILQYLKAEKYITKLWKERGVTFKN